MCALSFDLVIVARHTTCVQVFEDFEGANMSLGLNLSKYISPHLLLWHCEFQFKCLIGEDLQPWVCV